MANLNETPNAALLLDRFVSASTAQDAHSSLQDILEGLQNGHINLQHVLDEEDVLTALLQVLQTSQYKQMPVEQGSSLAARIYLEILKNNATTSGYDSNNNNNNADSAIMLQEPAPGRLLETLVDVASDPDATAYARVLAIQAVLNICKGHGKIAQNQLLQAPNGLHRLGDLLRDENEQVRNEALLLAGYLAAWPAVAKVWMFSEVGDVVISVAVQEGGLTGGNVVVLDCLLLLYNMLRHDAALADLVFQSPTMAPQLAKLLDLRGGRLFLNPVAVKQKSAAAADDDLDDLLSGKSTHQEQPVERVMPRLTAPEEKVLDAVIDILSLVLENESVKQSVWKKQPGLCSLIWEMGLLLPPPPGEPFRCALPSPALQQRALELTAVYFNDPVTMDRHSGTDRLLYLACTGGIGETLDEKMGLSQAALFVLRNTQSAETANLMLMHTLAPPMEDLPESSLVDPGAEPAAPTAPPMTAVQRLLNTLTENLVAPEQSDAASQERRKLFLAGSTTALSIFLTDEASREIMLRLTGNNSLVDTILEGLGNSEGQADDFIPLVLLRFMCQWVYQAPGVVQALLSSCHSPTLSVLFAVKQEKVTTLTSLLLGLSMEYMNDESKCGGWTRSGIMEMISKRGVSRITSGLEKFKTLPPKELPWSPCELEWNLWSRWYNDCVLVVRKRVVQELTGGDEDLSESAGDDANETTPTTAGLSSLQKVVAQQSSEIDELRESLVKSEKVVASQDKELATWKLRSESTPTQLDDLLSESNAKNTELDQKIASLEEQIRLNDKKHQSELEARDASITSLESNLQEVKSLQEETREERDSLREDMTALSDAYSNLEVEYHQRQAGQSSTATSAPTGEQEESSRQQPEGEVSQQTPTGSNEVSALRAENARLKQDATAAADWMSTAFERINGMGGENTSLQQQVASLEEQLQNTSAVSTESSVETERLVERMNVMGVENASLQQQVVSFREQLHQASAAHVETSTETDALLSDERLKRQNVEAELANAIESINSDQVVKDEQARHQEQLEIELAQLREAMQHFEEVRRRNEALEDQVGSLHANVQSAGDSETNWNAHRDGLEREIQELTMELGIVRDELSSMKADGTSNQSAVETTNSELSSEVSSLRGTVELLQSQLAAKASELETRASNDGDTELLTLRTTVESLQSQLATATSELENANGRQQEEIYARESRIRELESRMGAGLTGYTVSDVLSRDAEISELQNSNEAAQNWMAKAVEHHQVLCDQVATATEEKTSLKAKMKSLEEQLAADPSRVVELEGSLSLQNTELERLRIEMANQSQVVNGTQSEDLESELEALRGALRANEDSIHRLQLIEQSAGQLEAQIEQKNAEIDAIRLELESRDTEIQQLRTHASRAEQLEERIPEYMSELEALRSDVVSKEHEIDRVRSTEAEEVEERRVELEVLKLELAALRETLAAQDEEKRRLDSRAATADRLEIEVQQLALEVESLRGTCNSKDEELASTLQKVSTDNDHLLQEKARLEEELLQTVENLKAVRENLNQDEEVVHEWEDRVAELESVVKSLEGELEEQSNAADGAIAQWQESYTTLETRSAELGRQVETLSREKEELVSPTEAGEQAGILEGLRTENERLESELRTCTKELEAAKENLNQDDENVVHEWEDRVAELESVVKSLEGELEEQSNAADGVIAQWQESYASLETRGAELGRQVETLSREKEELGRSSPSEAGEQAGILEGVRTENERLEAELRTCTKELEAAKENLNQDENVVHEWEDRVAELESAVKSLEDQLEEQSTEADGVIAQWQESYSSLETRGAELEAELEALRTEKDALLSEVPTFDEAATISGLEAKIELHLSQITELESKLGASADDLLQRQDEHASSISAQAEHLAEAEAAISMLEEERERERAEKEELVSKFEFVETAITDKEQLLESLKADLEAEHGNVEGLQTTLLERESELAEEREEAMSAISEWESCYKQLEERFSAVEGDLVRVSEQKDETAESLQVAETTLAVERESFKQFSSECEEKARLVEQTKNAVDGTDSSSEDAVSLRGQLEEERQALAAAQQELADLAEDSEETVNLWKDKVDELEAILQEMEGSLEQQKSDADEAISRWEARALELDRRVLELETDATLQSNEASVNLIRMLQSELRFKQRLLSLQNPQLDLKDNGIVDQAFDVDSASSHILKLKTLLEERNASLASWLQGLDIERSSMEHRCEELNEKLVAGAAEMNEVQGQLEHARLAVVAPASSMSRVEGLEEMVGELENEIDRLRSRCVELTTSTEETREQSSREITSLQEQIIKLEEASESQQAANQFETKRDAALEQQRDELEYEKTSLVEERDRLQQRVGELEEELLDISDTMQAHLTNEVSDRATEIAAEALNYQVHEIRAQAELSQAAFDGERQARIVSEKEANRLRADLAAFHGLEDNDDTHAEIQRRTVDATENLHRTERSDIESLKKALSRALDELEAIRGTEKDVQARASKADLQVSMYENEMIEAKSDLKFMTQTMDEMREAESSSRASLEYRIRSLENDHSVEQRFHATDMENLHNELQQVTMERDRLFQSLKESEKAKDALLRASSNSKNVGGDGAPQIELAKLRVEKAQLLSATSEETSKAERRLREAVAAVSSSAEAGVLMEKELRLAAEKALENVKLEMNELQTEVDSNGVETTSVSETTQNELRRELYELKARVQVLSDEKASLQRKLETAKSDAHSKIERLTEDYQNAKLRTSQLEREGRYEAEVQAEVARLMASQAPEANAAHRSFAQSLTNGHGKDEVVTGLYDEVQNQKQAIVEERTMYRELLVEHDDLLAVLAQQNIIKTCLDSALVEAAGPEAVDLAMRKAESMTIEQYGQRVELG